MPEETLNASVDFLSDQVLDQARFIPSYIRSQCVCQLCAQNYDLQRRVPMMLCQSQHHCCLVCVKQIILRKNQCPFCRVTINNDKIIKNRMVCKILQEMAKKKGLKYKINEHPEKEFSKPKPRISASIIDADANNYIIAPQNNDFNAPLLQNQQNRINLFDRLNCQKGQFCLAYFMVFFLMTPFMICQLVYGFSLDYQNCMDVDYGVGMTTRTWLISSGLIASSMQFLQFLSISFRCCLPRSLSKFPKIVSIMNIIFYVLKFLGYNILGIVVFNSVSSEDQGDNCDGSLSAYMTAIFIIEIIFFSSLCALADRR